jgi:hypothetical protein
VKRRQAIIVQYGVRECEYPFIPMSSSPRITLDGPWLPHCVHGVLDVDSSDGAERCRGGGVGKGGGSWVYIYICI